MNRLIFQSNEELNKAGAGLIISLLHTKPNAVLGLATGRTPTGIYAELVKAYRRDAVRFDHCRTFNLDEYIGLPREHSESFFTYMEKHLFSQVNLSSSQTHLPDGSAADPHAEAARYDALLNSVGQIDLQILGIGHNGHIGFNEPSGALTSATHVVELDERTRQANARSFSSIDDVPTQAITMGIGSIMKAKTVLLVVSGEDKAEIVHRSLTGPITTQCPASLLQTHPSLIVMMDTAAAKLFR